MEVILPKEYFESKSFTNKNQDEKLGRSSDNIYPEMFHYNKYKWNFNKACKTYHINGDYK